MGKNNDGLNKSRIVCIICTFFILYLKVSRWFLGGFPFKQIKILNIFTPASRYSFMHIKNYWHVDSFFALVLASFLILGWLAIILNLIALFIKKYWISIISLALSFIMFIYDGFFALGHIVALDDGYVGHDVLPDMLLIAVSLASFIILLVGNSNSKKINNK